jgi:L-aminopeptidase/D-esterase-like protein
MTMNDTLTAVPGLLVGHYTDTGAATGCTVILSEAADGMGCGLSVRGQAPGSREHALLAPGRLVQQIHGLLLTGGSAYGLSAADGVMQWLAERGRGFPVGVDVVPIVPASVIFDLALGQNRRPGPTEGYAACEAATAAAVTEGNVGAGTGATVGKLLGPSYSMKGGLGSAVVHLAGRITVGALAVVNAFGDVIDQSTGQILAGTRNPQVGGFLNTSRAMRGHLDQTNLAFFSNTTLAVVATDAALNRVQLTVLADAASAGMARAINPVHTLLDGDTVYALSTGAHPGGNLPAIAAAAADAVAEAIHRAVHAAETLHGIPSMKDLSSNQSH